MVIAGTVAMVSGAGSGIGQRQALALAQAGASAVLLGRRKEQLDSAVPEIEAFGGKAAPLAVDLSDRERLTEVAKRAARSNLVNDLQHRISELLSLEPQ